MTADDVRAGVPLPPRAARLAALESRTFDALVVGGGITGAATARDLASRGLAVALVEREDWASGTSWRSSKLVHGGLRYLAKGDLLLVFQSLAERARLLRLAPHLVSPLEFVFAILRGRWVSPPSLAAGLTLYDLLALGRGRRHRGLSVRAAVEAEPLLAGSDLAGGAFYSDAATDDARLTLENVLDAWALGAVAVSRVSVDTFLRSGAGGRVDGAAARDLETGREFRIQARVTVEAAGPWTDALRRAEDPGATPTVRLSKGSHITVPFAVLPVRRAVAIPAERGRLVFVIPSGPVTLIGTTDADYRGPVDGVGPEPAEVDYLLARAREAFPSRAPRRADVIASFAGLRPLRFEAGKDVASTSREESVDVSPGRVVVTGGKLTTHRRMGRRAGDAVASELRGLGVRSGKSATAARRFPGAPDGAMEAFVERFAGHAASIPEESARHLARRYGTRAEGVLALASEGGLGRALVSGLPDIEAEVVFAARCEDARTASDVLIRRTHLFWQAADQGVAALPRVQELLGKELDWSEEAASRSRDEYLREVEKSRLAFAE
ncbi:MAG: glycerol-3-phosphate dehydrogenase/oxidase [Acidobacteria bacterium]|nr:glycerol-3-phosphate dehydrogenase/oxidase [Acidobacteriota bacterium]MCA1610230.1 glycerol-3-phosphate dehydrogenase/oxidase [Acidobacteriota bacterium]